MEYAAASGDAWPAIRTSLAPFRARSKRWMPPAEFSTPASMHILAASSRRRAPSGRYVNAARLFTPSGRVGVQER
jgi:hypothetical protein